MGYCGPSFKRLLCSRWAAGARAARRFPLEMNQQESECCLSTDTFSENDIIIDPMFTQPHLGKEYLKLLSVANQNAAVYYVAKK